MSYQQPVERIEVDVDGHDHNHVYTDPVSHSHVSYTVDYPGRIVQVQRVVWFILGILETVLGLRVLLRLIGANPNAGFAQFIYNLTYPFLLPFFNLVPTPTTEGIALEISTLIAMLVYALLFFFVSKAIRLVMSRRSF